MAGSTPMLSVADLAPHVLNDVCSPVNKQTGLEHVIKKKIFSCTFSSGTLPLDNAFTLDPTFSLDTDSFPFSTLFCTVFLFSAVMKFVALFKAIGAHMLPAAIFPGTISPVPKMAWVERTGFFITLLISVPIFGPNPMFLSYRIEYPLVDLMPI